MSISDDPMQSVEITLIGLYKLTKYTKQLMVPFHQVSNFIIDSFSVNNRILTSFGLDWVELSHNMRGS